jgi:hypothetical protein
VEVSALKMPKGRTPVRGDLDYFVLCCTIEEIFQCKGLNSRKAFRLTSCYFRSDIPTKQSLCGKLQKSKNKPNTLLLFCDKWRLKFGTILGSYFFFIGGYGPSIWLIFSDDSLKVKVLILAK